jgi:polynucleotide 5'-kinase involved in rRNA processing
MSKNNAVRYKRLLVIGVAKSGVTTLANSLRKRLGSYVQVIDTNYHPPALLREDYTAKTTDIAVSTLGFLDAPNPQQFIDTMADQVYSLIKEQYKYDS